jgi:hypothetical protein
MRYVVSDQRIFSRRVAPGEGLDSGSLAGGVGVVVAWDVSSPTPKEEP